MAALLSLPEFIDQYPAFNHMRKLLILLVVFLIALSGNVFAQDTLPRITVRNVSNKIIISWKNMYGAKISNINIQRSYDSLRNFTTIGTVLNPLNKENGFVDSKASRPDMFYRVFVAFEGGDYVFSKSHRPVIDTSRQITPESVIESEEPDEELLPGNRKGPPKTVTPNGFVASKFIYTGRDNNLVISLPDAAQQKFSIQFYDDKDRPILEIKKIKEPYVIVEKVNFLHAGWFYYHLYDDGILLEKYKFYIGKDGHSGPPPPEINKNTPNKR